MVCWWYIPQHIKTIRVTENYDWFYRRDFLLSMMFTVLLTFRKELKNSDNWKLAQSKTKLLKLREAAEKRAYLSRNNRSLQTLPKSINLSPNLRYPPPAFFTVWLRSARARKKLKRNTNYRASRSCCCCCCHRVMMKERACREQRGKTSCRCSAQTLKEKSQPVKKDNSTSERERTERIR